MSARPARRHLDPTWDHSGWPFTDSLTPFTSSLVIVLLILLGGLLLTTRGKAWAGYWLGASMVLGAIVTVVHFVPTANQESPAVIYGSWPDQPVVGALAVANTFAIVAALVLMGVNAVRVRRRSGIWRRTRDPRTRRCRGVARRRPQHVGAAVNDHSTPSRWSASMT